MIFDRWSWSGSSQRNTTKNMWILKFKSQLTFAFFATVIHLRGPLRKQNFSLTDSKGHGLWFVIGGFWSVLCVSVFLCFCVSRFVDCDCNYDWWQPKTQLWRQVLNFRVRMFVKRAVTARMLDILQFPTTNSVTSVNLKKAGVASRNIVKTKQYTLLWSALQ